MHDKIRGKMETRAPDVAFQDLHPTVTGKRPFKRGPDLPPSGPSDGLESKFTNCYQCGFPINTDEVTEGSGYGNMTPTITYPANTVLDDYSLGGTTSAGGSTTAMVAGTVGGRIITPTSIGNLRYIAAYIAPTSATDMVGLVYRLSDGVLLSAARERIIASGAGWSTFPLNKAVQTNPQVNLVVTLQAEDSAWNLYYTGSGSGRYVTGTYDQYPARVGPAGWTSVDALYSVFVSSYPSQGHYDIGASYNSTNQTWNNAHGGCPHCGASNWKGKGK